MPVDLLHALEPATPVAVSLENIEALIPVVAREVGQALEGLKGSALAFETVWRRLVMDVARGQTAEMQAARPHLVSAFEKRLGLLKDTHLLAQWLVNIGRPTGTPPDVLLPEIERMERLKANVFDRWQSAEDLEELAARDYPLTTADLDRIGPQRRPAASYYAEEGKPF